jgi:tetratricopeptide (TPR) repeat protein
MALLARVATGRFLITSRRASGWHNLATPIRLDVLDETEAVDLLTRILTQEEPRDLDGAGELCVELGYLPLAVEQAGAYLAETGATPREYLRLLGSYPAAMYRASAEGGDAERTIARVWHVTLDRLAVEPLTGQVLRILAWYASDDIPRTLLDGLADPPALMGAIGRLAAYSLLTSDADSLAVHRLVQAVARTPEPGDPHRDPDRIAKARDHANSRLLAALPNSKDPAGWSAWRLLLPHVYALASHSRPESDTPATAHLLNLAALFLSGQGLIIQAIAYLQRALADRQRVLGPDHPDTLASCSNVAFAYRAAGDLSRSIPLHEQVLADTERVLGPDHPQTLTSRSNLAGAYQAAGNLDRVIPPHEQVLADRQRVLGPDHPDTLTSRINLAGAYQAAGNLDRAIPLYQQVLADTERVLGPDHPDTLTSRNNLAYAYRAAGDLDRAIPLHEQVLPDLERVLGPDHPHALTSRNNLASAYQAAGNLDRAIPLYQQALPDRQRVLGPDHPHALASRNNLAGAYRAAGDLDRAISQYEQVLADAERVLGGKHRVTKIARDNLAVVRQQPR